MKLSVYMQKRRLTIRAMAAMIGVPHSQVYKWTRGITAPSVLMALRIQQVTDNAVKCQDWHAGAND